MFVNFFVVCLNSFLFAVKRHGQFIGVVRYRNTIYYYYYYYYYNYVICVIII